MTTFKRTFFIPQFQFLVSEILKTSEETWENKYTEYLDLFDSTIKSIYKDGNNFKINYPIYEDFPVLEKNATVFQRRKFDILTALLALSNVLIENSRIKSPGDYVARVRTAFK